MKKKLPKVSFSKWTQWNKRETLQDINFPGVYLLAKFSTVPTGRANPPHKNIIYIGETCKRTLKKRWKEVNSSAFQSKNNPFPSKGSHSGGRKYRDKYNDTGKNLYVAAFPIKDLDDELIPWFIRFQERKLLLDFVCKYGATCLLNKK